MILSLTQKEYLYKKLDMQYGFGRNELFGKEWKINFLDNAVDIFFRYELIVNGFKYDLISDILVFEVFLLDHIEFDLLGKKELKELAKRIYDNLLNEL